MKKNGFGKPNYIIYVLAAVLAAGSFSVIQSAMAQNKRIRDAEKKENYNRPAPARPIKPTIPDANRYQDDKVFLEYADSLCKAPPGRDVDVLRLGLLLSAEKLYGCFRPCRDASGRYLVCLCR